MSSKNNPHMNVRLEPLYTRRSMLRCGFLGAAGLMLAGKLAAQNGQGGGAPGAADLPTATGKPAFNPKAKAVIQIWLWGGACHLDTFDPKPDAGAEFSGPLTKPIETNVSGMRISELLPSLSKQGDKYSLIRSLNHGIFGHETASYMVQTGRMPGDRYVYPSVGAVVNLFKGYDAGYKSLIPPYIVLTEPQGRFSEAGFLGTRYKPFATGGDPAKVPFAVEGVTAEGLSEARQKSRREFLGKMNSLGRAAPSSPIITATAQSEQQAYELILGDAGRVFDLNQESEQMREAYGKNTFGQSCLAARRLVERGVPFVTINFKGWDTHKQHFQAMRRMLPELDKGLAMLLQDLRDRGLLDSTIVWCSGEFGRTPKVQWEAPWNGGRGHWGKVFSALIAGGGFKGGQVVGSSDARGEEVASRPVYPSDIIASVYEQLGISADARLPHPEGLPTKAVPSVEEGVKTGGRLSEIM